MLILPVYYIQLHFCNNDMNNGIALYTSAFMADIMIKEHVILSNEFTMDMVIGTIHKIKRDRG